MTMKISDPQFLLHKSGKYEMSFEISDEKEKAGDATINYYGWLASNGAWIIQEINSTNGTYRYIAGLSAYAANFTARESLTYSLFSAITIGE